MSVHDIIKISLIYQKNMIKKKEKCKFIFGSIITIYSAAKQPESYP